MKKSTEVHVERKKSRSPKRQLIGKNKNKPCNRGQRCWSVTQGRHCPFEHPKKEDAPVEAFLRVVEMDTAIDQDFREERAMARFYPRSEAAIAAEAAAAAEARAEAEAVVAAWEAQVVAPPAAAPPGAAPAEGEAEDLLPFQRAMDGFQPDSPTYNPFATWASPTCGQRAQV